MSRTKLTALCTAAGLGLSGIALVGGCGAPELDPEEVEVVENAKSDAFRGRDNPAYAGETFIYDPADLPVEAHTPAVPIAGDYWAVYKDSINVRWNGDEMSPAEKVEKAFNLPGFAKYVTENFGVYQDGFTACATNEDCKDETDKTAECAKPRVPETSDKPGRCVPTWWGICHGWAPYAVSEPAPKNSVTRNGVTFHPGDLTALMSFIYGQELPTKFLSGRCNQFDKNLSTDSQGRVVAGECRDNPGTTFIIATNLIGKRKQGFVVDRTADYEVWNQPVEGYKVTNAVDGKKLKEITKAEAIKMLGLGFNFSQVFAAMDLAKDQEQKGVFTAPAAGELVFKLSGTEGDADLFVKKGETVTRDDNECRSTGSSASEECKITVAAGDKVSYLAFGYSASKKVALQVGVPGTTANYTYNTAAARFYHVELDLYWIQEQGPGTTQPDPRNTLRTDHMSMILEADEKGLITGGEWLGESKKKHTDFIWWPTAKPGANLHGLTYDLVKALNDESAGTAVPTTPEETVVFQKADLKYSTPYDAQFGSIGAPAGTKKIEFTMTGTGGNADLYVRLGSKPTTYTFTGKSTAADANEKVTIDIPATGGTVYARARVPVSARSATVNVKITAKLIK